MQFFAALAAMIFNDRPRNHTSTRTLAGQTIMDLLLNNESDVSSRKTD